MKPGVWPLLNFSCLRIFRWKIRTLVLQQSIHQFSRKDAKRKTKDAMYCALTILCVLAVKVYFSLEDNHSGHKICHLLARRDLK